MSEKIIYIVKTPYGSVFMYDTETEARAVMDKRAGYELYKTKVEWMDSNTDPATVMDTP